MKTLPIIAFLALIAIENTANAQLLNKVKQAKNLVQDAKESSQSGGNNSGTTETVNSPEEIEEEESTSDLYNINGTNYRMMPEYKTDDTDRVGLSGYYHLSQYLLDAPSSHFSSEPGKIYQGFSINYNPDTYEAQIYFSAEDSNYANIAEHYHKSADKGNILFQFGMQGGPSNLTNVQCLILEPGVLLLGANVYHKNDEVGHQWMNNITPEQFVIASKDTAKIKLYEKNVEYTSAVVFEKFDALRRVSQQQEIEDAQPLPTPGMEDKALRADALKLIKTTADAYEWKEEVLYAYVTSTEWEIQKHPLTGIPLKRVAKCIVVMKTPDGNYKREGFYVAQNYNGANTYGSTFMLYNDQRIYYVNPNEALKYQ